MRVLVEGKGRAEPGQQTFLGHAPHATTTQACAAPCMSSWNAAPLIQGDSLLSHLRWSGQGLATKHDIGSEGDREDGVLCKPITLLPCLRKNACMCLPPQFYPQCVHCHHHGTTMPFLLPTLPVILCKHSVACAITCQI